MAVHEFRSGHRRGVDDGDHQGSFSLAPGHWISEFGQGGGVGCCSGASCRYGIGGRPGRLCRLLARHPADGHRAALLRRPGQHRPLRPDLHRPGFTFTRARSPERVRRYEYMPGEKLRPWFQGDGAHYLYLAGDDQREAFGVDYFTVVDPERLGGVTAPIEERKTIPELYGQSFYDNPDAGFTSSSVKQNLYVYFPLGTNVFSGGSTLGTYAVAGMQQADDAAYAAKQA